MVSKYDTYNFEIKLNKVQTKNYTDQKPGTSGLRKKVIYFYFINMKDGSLKTIIYRNSIISFIIIKKKSQDIL